jgi:hypothetical protein
MTQKTNNPWLMDVRVRERNLKSGALTDKDLEKQLAALPDVSDQAESFAIAQPALAQQHAVESVSDGIDDEDDDDVDDEDDNDDGDNSDGESTSNDTGSNGATDVGSPEGGEQS